MRKYIIILTVLIMALSTVSFAETVYERPEIEIIVNGKEIEVTNVPIIVNSRTLVPLRNLIVALGVPDNNEAIVWNGDLRTVKVTHEGKVIDLKIDSTEAYVNGVAKYLDSPAIIYQNRTYLPARFVGEALEYTISWDQYTPAVIVNKNTIQNTINDVLSKMNMAVAAQKKCSTLTTVDLKTGVGNEDLVESRVSVIENINIPEQEMGYITIYQDEVSTTKNYKYFKGDKSYQITRVYEGEKVTYEPQEWSDTSSFSYDNFENRAKLGMLNINEDLFGMFTIEQSEDRYFLKTCSKQTGILTALEEAGLYVELLTSSENIKELEICITVSKLTNLPMGITVKLKVEEYLGNEEDFITEEKYISASFNYVKEISIIKPLI